MLLPVCCCSAQVKPSQPIERDVRDLVPKSFSICFHFLCLPKQHCAASNLPESRNN